MKAAILIFPGVEELDFVGVYEVLAKAQAMAREGTINLKEPLEVELVAFVREVECANGMTVLPHALYHGLQGSNTRTGGNHKQEFSCIGKETGHGGDRGS